MFFEQHQLAPYPRNRSLGRRPSEGFTLLETVISLGVFGILLVSVFSITVETSSFLGDTEDDVAVQMDATRAYARITDLLRKSGRVDEGGVTYPRVTGGGSELEFRVGADLDGNGHAFDGTTGALEWDPRIFTLKTDADGNFDVYDGVNKVYFLGRNISSLSFETIAEDSTLHLKEIAIQFEARKQTAAGHDVVFEAQGSVHMRN